jgi:hypothetical protein
MRAILVDWIIEVHHKFELMHETLYLTMYIIDQYLSLQPVLRRELQLVGVSAMLIACKYEEIWAPEVHRKLSSLCLSYVPSATFQVFSKCIHVCFSGERLHPYIRQCIQ